MKTPREGLKCLGRKDIMYLISYVVLFCSVLNNLILTLHFGHFISEYFSINTLFYACTT
jgi:hypothetical protein